MADNDRIATLADAFARAETEEGSGEPNVTEAASPAAEANVIEHDEQADAGADDQLSDATEESHDEVLELLQLGIDEDADSEETPGGVDWNTQVEVSTVDGAQQVTLAELRDGYMKDADYRRKTQELAEARNQHEDAVQFFQELQAHPTEVVAYLAQQAGLIKEGERPVREVAIELPTPERLAEMVEERARELINDDPRVKQAELVAAQARVDQEFAAIEETHNVSLSKEARRAVMREAVKLGVDSLETTYEVLLARANSRKSKASGLKDAAPSRPGSRAPTASADEAPVGDIGDAMARAMAELGLQ